MYRWTTGRSLRGNKEVRGKEDEKDEKVRSRQPVVRGHGTNFGNLELWPEGHGLLWNRLFGELPPTRYLITA